MQVQHARPIIWHVGSHERKIFFREDEEDEKKIEPGERCVIIMIEAFGWSWTLIFLGEDGILSLPFLVQPPLLNY